MHPDVKKVLNVMAVFFAAIIIVTVVAVISILRETGEIENRVQSKIEKAVSGQQTIKIVKYDTLTQSRLDSIEVHRSMSHRHVDNLYDGELQSLLDSVYNGR